jgi:hypothetical protein
LRGPHNSWLQRSKPGGVLRFNGLLPSTTPGRPKGDGEASTGAREDPLEERALAQMILGVSMRGYAGALEKLPVPPRERGLNGQPQADR